MPIRKIKQINLIPQDEFEISVLGRILKWALSTFRVMVIITELIVMSAFLSRFWLDARNSDLNDSIETAKAQVQAYSQIESEFRLRQKQLAIAKTFYNQNSVSDLLSDVFLYTPSGVVLNSISISENILSMKARSIDEEQIAQFLTNLEFNKNLDDISITQLSSNAESDSNMTFSVTAKVKGGAL